jgi:hypothetical protein
MESGWLDLEDALKIKPPEVRSVGYVLKETKEYIILAGDLGSDQIDKDVGRVTVIPGQWIVDKKIEKVISYQDTAVHLGTIYKAANWTQSNISSGGEWTRQSRARGKVQTAVPKVRWEFLFKSQDIYLYKY